MSNPLRIVETSDNDMHARYWDRFYRPQRDKIGPLTSEAECGWAFIQLSVGAGEADLAALERAIVDLSGVDNCKICVSGVVPAANRIPANREVYATLEGRFVLQEEIA